MAFLLFFSSSFLYFEESNHVSLFVSFAGYGAITNVLVMKL